MSPTALCAAGAGPATAASAPHASPFVIEIVDEQTGRGVPMVELETVNNIRFVTDSNGIIALHDPGLMNRQIFFTIKSHGYEFPADFLGFHGKALDVKPAGQAKLTIKRLNIAERIYRVTGEGIYADTLLTGRTPPIAEPMLNAQVVGQDSVQAAIYRRKIYWFWGDTNRFSYPLGNFNTTGATSDLPSSGGLDPNVGVNLHYFTDPTSGFVKKMYPFDAAPTPIWIDGLLTLNDDQGRERLLAHFSRMKDLGTRLERGLLVFDDEKQQFEKLIDIPLDAPLAPFGHPFRVKRATDGSAGPYIYFPAPYPNIRVKADWKSLTDVSTYEAFTPVITGTRFAGAKTKLDRREGKLIFAWRKNTSPLSGREQEELFAAGLMKREETPHQLQDATTRKPIILHSSAVHWSEFRKKWVMIAQELNGVSKLGEIWYSEAPEAEGPWSAARKIVTHEKYSFYNPDYHDFFDASGGRFIYLEATYSNALSETDDPTPRYDYNQIMYRLDLSDPRLNLGQ